MNQKPVHKRNTLPPNTTKHEFQASECDGSEGPLLDGKQFLLNKRFISIVVLIAVMGVATISNTNAGANFSIIKKNDILPYMKQKFANNSAKYMDILPLELGNTDEHCFGKSSQQGMIEPRNWGSSRSNTGNTYRLHEVLQYRKDNTMVKVLIMGGSLTAGQEVGGKNNSWASMLANITELSHLNITNRAQGATGTVNHVQNLGTLLDPFDWDIVMIEAALNDDDVCDNCRYSSESDVTLNFEQLVRSIRLLIPQSAIVIVEAFRQSKAPRNGFTSGQNQHDVISKYYELPVISIRDAIWHDYDEDIRNNRKSPLTEAFPQRGQDNRKFWGGSHPAPEGQKLICDIVAHEL
eukprot:scaffold63518_cov42-Cyclotella_meneghiniana.AAC.1